MSAIQSLLTFFMEIIHPFSGSKCLLELSCVVRNELSFFVSDLIGIYWILRCFEYQSFTNSRIHMCQFLLTYLQHCGTFVGICVDFCCVFEESLTLEILRHAQILIFVMGAIRNLDLSGSPAVEVCHFFWNSPCC